MKNHQNLFNDNPYKFIICITKHKKKNVAYTYFRIIITYTQI